MRKIYLVRHGQSTGNAGGEAKRNDLIELTDLGHQQADDVAQWLNETLAGDIDSISVSKFLRTQQTAQPLLDITGLTPNVVDGLHEFDYLSLAKMAGLTFEERLQITDEYWRTYEPTSLHGDDTESFTDFYNRVEQVMIHFNSLPDGNHVVFTHGLWISMLVWQILNQPADTQEQLRKFRQFEMSIRAKNCEVFCLSLPSAASDSYYPPAITKVRTCSGPNSDLSAKSVI